VYVISVFFLYNLYLQVPGVDLKKYMIFWRKTVIFHTKYPQNFRASLRSTQFF
jgi:hypothetical protein